MSRIAATRCLFAAALLTSVGAQAADEYEIDGSHTYPMFAISHSGLSTLHGRFNDTSGHFTMDRDGDKSRVEAVIRVASLDSGHEQRDKILRGEKFFDASKFPEMRYVSTRVKFTGAGTATVEGKLTLHGVTQAVTLDVQHLAAQCIRCSAYGLAASTPMPGSNARISA